MFHDKQNVFSTIIDSEIKDKKGFQVNIIYNFMYLYLFHRLLEIVKTNIYKWKNYKADKKSVLNVFCS